MPTFKELLAADRVVRIFNMGRIVHPVVIDLVGLAGGYDGFWLDQEHGGLTYEQIQLAALCARANRMDCFVRMAPVSYSLVTQNLEAGAGGTMVARLNSATEAEEFMTWAKFAPRGNRGLNPTGRDALYSHTPAAEFAAEANRESFVAIQIETRGALNEAEQIAAIDGVDVLFVGPADLSQALGVLGQLGHASVWDGIQRVADACRRNGKNWGIVPADPDYAQRCVEMGCRMLSIGSDARAMRNGIASIKSAYQRFF